AQAHQRPQPGAGQDAGDRPFLGVGLAVSPRLGPLGPVARGDADLVVAEAGLLQLRNGAVRVGTVAEHAHDHLLFLRCHGYSPGTLIRYVGSPTNLSASVEQPRCHTTSIVRTRQGRAAAGPPGPSPCRPPDGRSSPGPDGSRLTAAPLSWEQ